MPERVRARRLAVDAEACRSSSASPARPRTCGRSRRPCRRRSARAPGARGRPRRGARRPGGAALNAPLPRQHAADHALVGVVAARHAADLAEGHHRAARARRRSGRCAARRSAAGAGRAAAAARAARARRTRAARRRRRRPWAPRPRGELRRVARCTRGRCRRPGWPALQLGAERAVGGHGHATVRSGAARNRAAATRWPARRPAGSACRARGTSRPGARRRACTRSSA